jgi:hypothetical protein
VACVSESVTRAAHPVTWAAHPVTRAAHPVTRAAHPDSRAAHPRYARRTPPRSDPVTGRVVGALAGVPRGSGTVWRLSRGTPRHRGVRAAGHGRLPGRAAPARCHLAALTVGAPGPPRRVGRTSREGQGRGASDGSERERRLQDPHALDGRQPGRQRQDTGRRADHPGGCSGSSSLRSPRRCSRLRCPSGPRWQQKSPRARTRAGLCISSSACCAEGA